MSILEQRTTRRVSASRALAYLPGTALALDASLIVIAASVASIGQLRMQIFGHGSDLGSVLGIAAPGVVFTWLLCIAMMGGYAASVFDIGTDEYRRVAKGGLLAAGLVGVACYLLEFPLARGFFALVFVIGVPALLLGRMTLRSAVVRARQLGSLLHSVLLVGNPTSIDDVARVLARETRLGYRVAGALTPLSSLETPGGIPVLGTCDQVRTLVGKTGADVVFFVDGGITSAAQMRQIAWDFAERDLQVVVAPSVSDVAGDRVTVRPVGGLPLIHIDPPRSTDAARWGKRIFDIAGSLGLIVALSPLLAFAALRVRTHDRGPVLFRQTRVGRQGHLFSCLKFRTMVVDAEARLAELHEQIGHAGGLFKMRDDPRITKPGRWLRRFSVDELPQLFNVLRGDMSLIGPRPPLPLEVATYDEEAARRLHVRPGLTGLWQVSGRSDLSFDEAIRLDLYYVDNWSMFQDLSILVRTLAAVVRSRGAY